jgi:hypothetical protein
MAVQDRALSKALIDTRHENAWYVVELVNVY